MTFLVKPDKVSKQLIKVQKIMIDLDLWEIRIFMDVDNRTVGTSFSVDQPTIPEIGEMYLGYMVVNADLAIGCKTLFVMVESDV